MGERSGCFITHRVQELLEARGDESEDIRVLDVSYRRVAVRPQTVNTRLVSEKLGPDTTRLQHCYQRGYKNHLSEEVSCNEEENGSRERHTTKDVC